MEETTSRAPSPELAPNTVDYKSGPTQPQPQSKPPLTPSAKTRYQPPLQPELSQLRGSGLLWALYSKLAQTDDSQLSAGWKDDLDNLLIFAGLFSAVVTAFIIESRKGLNEDLQGTTNALLLSILQLQNATMLQGPLSTTSLAFPPEPFSPSQVSLWINGLWFASLTCSLGSAGAAMLAKSWVREYRKQALADPKKAALNRQARYEATLTWHFSTIVAIIPLFIHMAFFLFFAGMLVLLFADNIAIASCVTVIVAAVAVLYLFSTILPLWYPEIPFRTPLSTFLLRMRNRIRNWTQSVVRKRRRPPHASVLPGTPISQNKLEASSLEWLVENALKTANLQELVLALSQPFEGPDRHPAFSKPAVMDQLILWFESLTELQWNEHALAHRLKPLKVPEFKDCLSAIKIVTRSVTEFGSQSVIAALFDLVNPLSNVDSGPARSDALDLAAHIVTHGCETDVPLQMPQCVNSAAWSYFNGVIQTADAHPIDTFIQTCNALARMKPSVIDRTTARLGCHAVIAILRLYPPNKELLLILLSMIGLHQMPLPEQPSSRPLNGVRGSQVSQFLQSSFFRSKEEKASFVTTIARAYLTLESLGDLEPLSSTLLIEIERLMDMSPPEDSFHSQYGIVPCLAALKRRLDDPNRWEHLDWAVVGTKISNWTATVRQELAQDFQNTETKLPSLSLMHLIALIAPLTQLLELLPYSFIQSGRRDPSLPVLVSLLITKPDLAQRLLESMTDLLRLAFGSAEVQAFLQDDGCTKLAPLIKHTNPAVTGAIINFLDTLLCETSFIPGDHTQHFEPIWKVLATEIPLMENEQESQWKLWLRRSEDRDWPIMKEIRRELGDVVDLQGEQGGEETAQESDSPTDLTRRTTSSAASSNEPSDP